MSIRKDEQADYKLSSLRSFHSIVQVLKRTMNVNEIWMVETGGSARKNYEKGVDTYNIFAFKDFLEVMEILKPDLVIGFGGAYEYLERSMIKAAKSQEIPSVTVLGSFIELWVASSKIESRIVTGRLHALKDHGRNIFRKYIFMLRTFSRAGYSISYLLRTICKDLYIPFTSFSPIYTFGGADLNIISTPQWAELVEKKGIDRTQIVVTGDCSMDSVHQKLANISHNASANSLIEVLFVTTPMVEHGHWKPSMRKEVVTKVVSGLIGQFRGKINLRIKIHPVTERLEIYRQLTDPIDRTIEIIQSEDLFTLLVASDIIVSYGPTSALFQAILLGKPVIIMNLFNEDTGENIYLKEKIALECKTVDCLMKNIANYKALKADATKLNAFIKKAFYKFDGKCSERAAASICLLLKNHETPVQK